MSLLPTFPLFRSCSLVCLFSSVYCSVGEAEAVRPPKTLFYVFGSEAIYIVDPESKQILSTIGAEGICTKSRNQFSR